MFFVFKQEPKSGWFSGWFKSKPKETPEDQYEQTKPALMVIMQLLLLLLLLVLLQTLLVSTKAVQLSLFQDNLGDSLFLKNIILFFSLEKNVK